MAKKLKIVSITSEVAPFSKTGGMADVTRSLPKAIKRLGHEIISITPLYGKVIDIEENNLKLIFKDVKIKLNAEDTIVVSYWKGYLMKGLPVYFVENKKYFSQRKTLYGSGHENARFFAFDVAALKLISLLKFEADIIQCHDWQTGLVPYLHKTFFKGSKVLKNAKTIYTIHNLIFQMGQDWWTIPSDKKDYGRSRIPNLNDPDLEYINFAKRGIISADAINAVSEQYSKEIMTKHFGQDLHRTLRNRKDRLFGIVNGISYEAFNPMKDFSLKKNYNYEKLQHKKVNKAYIQEKFGFPVDEKIPLICTTSRVTFQKGFELILKIMEPLMQMNLQLIIIGDGDKRYIKELKKLERKYPKKLLWLPFSKEKKNGKTYKPGKNYETLVYASSDIFLLPSHQEPCGINQMIAMRYGCIPVVRKVGGLYDTVTDFNPSTMKGTGFIFKDFNEFDLFRAMVRALETFKYPDVWKKIVTCAMQESNSWEIPAKKYIALFRKVMRFEKASKKDEKSSLFQKVLRSTSGKVKKVNKKQTARKAD